jgi:hypothetical protein
VAGSPAALAGLQDGDEVLDAPDLGDPTFKDVDKPLVMKIRRAGVESSVSFIPAGKLVSGYQWRRNARTSDADCKIQVLAASRVSAGPVAGRHSCGFWTRLAGSSPKRLLHE